jgi:hypothetical protein
VIAVATGVVQQRPNDMPVYWFAKLEKAVEEGDHQAAAEAQRELARLGIHVAYGRPKADTTEAHRRA